VPTVLALNPQVIVIKGITGTSRRREAVQMKRLLLRAILFIPLIVATFAAGDAKRTVRAAIGADGVQRVELMGGGYFFDPDHIIVKANIPVELTVRKESGIVPHNIVVKAPEAGIEIDESLSSDPKVIRFTPTTPGSYPIYCSKKLLFFESHREKGMEGVLEVGE
jgi:plastocyanin